MTDDSTDTLTEPPATEVVATEPAAPELPPVADAVPFWRRPNVERYVVPLVLPIVVLVGLVVFVLNLSRVFLAGHGQIPVIVGSVLTAGILIGATIFSNSKHLRSSSIALMTTIFVMVIVTSGWLVLGSSQEKGEASTPLAAAGPTNGNLVVNALASVKFSPVNFEVPTGIYAITLVNEAAAPHTLDFDDPETLYAGVAVNAAGEQATARAFFGEPGEYSFFCAIAGHRAAGMEGTITVTGPPITLEEAEAALGGRAAEVEDG